MHLGKSDFLCHFAIFFGSLLTFCNVYGCKGNTKSQKTKEKYYFLFVKNRNKCQIVYFPTFNPVFFLTPCTLTGLFRGKVSDFAHS